MNILIVSAFFAPEITPRAFRTLELVKELLRRNINVTLCIPYRKIDDLELKNSKNLQIIYLTDSPLLPNLPKGKNFFSRALRYIFSISVLLFQYPYIKLCYRIPKLLTPINVKYDLLISIAAPHAVHWGVARLLKKNSTICKYWIADCGDPFMGDSVHNHPFYFKFLEKKFCDTVDYITVPIEAAKDAYYKQYIDKIHVIPQGFDFESFKTLNTLYMKNEKPTFAYAGVLYPGYRDLNDLINYLAALNFDFKFILYTPMGNLVSSYKRILGDKLVVRSLLPRENLLYELSKMDFLVNIENKNSVQLPSKLIDYAITTRPILSLKSQIDIDVVNGFLHGDFSKRFVIENLSKYDIRNVVDAFLNLVHK